MRVGGPFEASGDVCVSKSNSKESDEAGDCIVVKVVYISGERVSDLRVRTLTALSGVKRRLAQICSTPETLLRLVVENQQVEGDVLERTVCEVGLRDGSIIHIVKLIPNPLTLFALTNDDVELAQYMLECDADPNETTLDQQSTLLFAAEQNFASVCQMLVDLDHFERINDVANTGHSALHWAAYWKLEDLCLQIVERDDFSAVNEVDCCGRLAFHYACSFGMASLCWAILERDDFHAINAIEGDNQSALHGAIASGMPDVAYAILTHPEFTDETLDQADYDGQTALMLAIQHRLEHLCDVVLRRMGLSAISIADKNGATALHYAAEMNMPTVCRTLLARAGGSLLKAQDARDMTAADVAGECGFLQVLDVLAPERRERRASAASGGFLFRTAF